MDEKKLEEVLEKHQLWLAKKEGGKYANLQGVNLRDVDLRAADLRYADLQYADLRYADLRCANLRCANLQRANLWKANLRDASLQGADLRKADLRDAELRGANLRGANLDYSCWPLWCGGLKVKIDDRIARQLLYHLLNCAEVSELSEDLKNALFAPELVEQANMFHRAEECGLIKG